MGGFLQEENRATGKGLSFIPQQHQNLPPNITTTSELAAEHHHNLETKIIFSASIEVTGNS